jgi:hypothetical protein
VKYPLREKSSRFGHKNYRKFKFTEEVEGMQKREIKVNRFACKKWWNEENLS